MVYAEVDAVVVGCGNAALCSAVAAGQEGARVLVLERAPRQKRGGNGIFTAGLVRFAYGGMEDIRTLVEVSDEEAAGLEVGSYRAADFFEDVARLGDYLADPDLLEALTTRSLPTMQWLRSVGVRFLPSFGLHAYRSGGKTFWRGNAPVEISGGGVGLVSHLVGVVEKQGTVIEYEARAVDLRRQGDRWVVTFGRGGERYEVDAAAVVLACGGFEANARMRAQYLGPGWDLARVRGTEFNTGDGLGLAFGVGAAGTGHWSGCHATPTDAETPRYGDRQLLHTFTRHSYNFGIMVNREGRRFVDEGQDLETHTYAKFGREILVQPGGTAYQIFDAMGAKHVRDEYWTGHASRLSADTLEQLAELTGVGPRLVETVREYNASTTDVAFDATTKDGKRTEGLTLPKSNWALPLTDPPFYAFPVVCGITFTYGGLRIDSNANVMDENDQPLPGLFAAGEIIGGIFYHNYPTATGITTGAVFGRTAGMNAAAFAGTAAR
jgi:tricarballylate dehydrogenase